MVALLKNWDAIVQSDETGQAKIRAAVQAYLNLFNSRPYLLRIIFFEGLFGEEPKDILITISEDVRRRIALLVDDGIAKMEFRRVDSQIAASLLMGMITELSIQTTLHGQPLLSNGQIADEVTTIFCQGIRR